MRVHIEVTDAKEAAALKAGLRDPQTRAFVISMGALLSLKGHSERERVLRFVESTLYTWRRRNAERQDRKAQRETATP